MPEPEFADERSLSEAVAAGDEPAFERLFRSYLNPLARYVYGYVHSWEVAEDIVHDVFLELWLRHRKLGPVRDIRAYLYAMARYAAMDYVRHQAIESRHRRPHVAPGTIMLDAARPPDAEQQVLAGEAAALLHRAVDALPPRQREVILLRWERQASYEEIGAALGISPKTVDAHLQRAIENLRQMLPSSLSSKL